LSNSTQTYPSIFNDVIGPVMRGPSSSHCAAAVRIGKMVRDLMDGEIKDVLIEFDPDGSLATTHVSQGSEMGLFGGLLGWDATDSRLADSPKAIQEAGINVKTVITPPRHRPPEHIQNDGHQLQRNAHNNCSIHRGRHYRSN